MANGRCIICHVQAKELDLVAEVDREVGLAQAADLEADLVLVAEVGLAQAQEVDQEAALGHVVAL